MNQVYLRVLTGASGAVFLGTFYFYTPPFYFSLLIIAAGLWVLTQELPQMINQKGPVSWLFASVYIGVPIYLLLILNQNYITRPLVLLTLFVCFAHDAAAYVTGTLFGKHLLAPKTSPKKTWEGCFGGFVAVLMMLFYLGKEPTTGILLILIALCISILATIGDLFESYLKRTAKLKDSGTLLPGQGGLLDRIDSILFVIPFVYLLQNVLLAILSIKHFG